MTVPDKNITISQSFGNSLASVDISERRQNTISQTEAFSIKISDAIPLQAPLAISREYKSV